MAYWNFIHGLGLHVYWIGTAVFGLASLVTLLVHNHNQKKREEDFEEELQEVQA